jgi:hypothetical protein
MAYIKRTLKALTVLRYGRANMVKEQSNSNSGDNTASETMEDYTMTTITMKDVAEHFAAYKAKFNEDCELPLDAIEQIMEEATDDEAMLQGMYEAQHTDDEDDRSDDAVPAVADTTEGSAYAYAEKMDPAMSEHLEVLAEAALQNKRGGAIILMDLHRLYGEDIVNDIWPVPGSKADNGRMLGNRLAAKYATTVRKEDGTTGEGTVDWFGEFIRYSPRGKVLYAQKESLRGIGQKETGPHILEEHKHLIGDAVKLKGAKSAIDGKISNAKASLVRAVQLSQRMAFCNKSTGLGCEISKDDDGQPAASNKLIYVYNTTDRSKFDVLTIGQFLALKNITEGAAYSAIVGSSTRKKKEVAKVDYSINSLEQFDTVVNALATFVDKMEQATAKKDMKAYNALLTRLNAAGSDDLVLELNSAMNFIESLLSKPVLADRLAKLLATERKIA